jgi:hypothetical protein
MEKWQRRGRQITDLTCEDWDRVSQGLPKHDERHEYVKMAKDIQSIVIEQEDMVNSPNHYTSGSIECIDGIEASMSAEAFKGYCKGAALKYLWRYERKDKSLEDLKKAQWYLKKLIGVVENED